MGMHVAIFSWQKVTRRSCIALHSEVTNLPGNECGSSLGGEKRQMKSVSNYVIVMKHKSYSGWKGNTKSHPTHVSPPLTHTRKTIAPSLSPTHTSTDNSTWHLPHYRRYRSLSWLAGIHGTLCAAEPRGWGGWAHAAAGGAWRKVGWTLCSQFMRMWHRCPSAVVKGGQMWGVSPMSP
jgi:hypothetical protein